MRYCPNTAAESAYASAVVIVQNLWAGADADRQAELIVMLAPHLEAAIHAYVEASNGWGEIPQPSTN